MPGVRQTRTCADPEVLPVRRDGENAAETTAAQLFHVMAESVQNLRQWFASCHPLKQLHFGRKQSLRLFQVVDIDLTRHVADDISVGVAHGDAHRLRPAIGAIRVEEA
jgi:hypothetical protein